MPSVALTKTAAQHLIKQYSSIINTNLDGAYNIDLVIQSLESKVGNLENLAMSAYSMFGVTGGNVLAAEAELKARVTELKQQTSSLNGIDLQKCFLKALKSATAFDMNYEQELKELQEYMAAQAGAEVRSGPTATLLMKEITQGLPQVFPKSISMSASGRAYDTRTGAPTFDFTKTYTQLSKKAKDIFDNYIKEKKKKGAVSSGSLVKSTISNLSMSQEYILENISTESLLKMKTEDRKKLFDNYPNLKDNINRDFIHQIVNSCSSQVDKKVLLSCIQQVLSKKPLAFFVGGNIEGMTGILGEIQALYYFKKLIKSNSNADVAWVGGINNPHSDLLLIEGLKKFGIQVKNTSRSAAELEVSFQSFGAKVGQYVNSPNEIWQYNNTDEALATLNSYGVPGDLMEAIQTFLAMEGFNVFYNIDASTGQAIMVDKNDKFAAERSSIEEYAAKAQKIASLLAVSMMYMQETDNTDGSSNTLYLIGGTTLISAATILSDIIEKLKSQLVVFKTSVEGHSVSKERKGAKTIVDVINSKGELGNTKFIMQSSYSFGL